ncbi:nitrogen permease regulator 2-domain-containing protein [Xylaria bambusicola]|uniref:nitrogen permease regulator 2-domain-containing protein n=1 Tax=Xylaria bambusicola TaxID=326684 RepID=UPI002007A1EC|nr:nitrogen permease regulator 2-domain-containing protein [Xylaria bambusicola]KAI0505648.1 nitrogen permease regulator 2-domain-containing protein [Xylaria bambusicola]
MIQGIFYARFLPHEGTKIVAQSPPGCIVATEFTPHLKPPLVDFDIVQEYIIPRKAFFNRLVTVNTPDGKLSILGFPVSIPHERYHRNEFLFNFGLVIESDVDQIPYERLVRRLAVTFAEMERQNGYLSSEGEVDDGRRPIESLLEIVKEDLNNYGECMIPVDEGNTINMKLFPYHAPPPPVHGWHVPVPKTKFADIMDSTWDLTLQKIIPHVDGVNDVRRIAWLADVSLPLTQCALQHLLYYDTILLLDMFFFGSCYALRPGIHDFVSNRSNLIDECAAYVCISPPTPSNVETNMTGSTASLSIPGLNPSTRFHESTTPRLNVDSTSSRPTTSSTVSLSPSKRISHYQLIKLMTTFCVGRSVMEWVRLHQESSFDVLRHIDVRRLVQFGVIKGLLYRVHKYAVSKSYLSLLATGRRSRISNPLISTTTTGERSVVKSDKYKGSKEKGGATKGKGKGKGKGIETATSPANDDDGLVMKMMGRRRQRLNRLGIHDNNNGDEDDDDDEAEEGNGNGYNYTNDNEEEDAEADDSGEDEGEGGNGEGGYISSPAKTRRKMRRYVDGRHPFDQIITEQNLTDAEIMRKLKSFEPGDLAVLYR